MLEASPQTEQVKYLQKQCQALQDQVDEMEVSIIVKIIIFLFYQIL